MINPLLLTLGIAQQAAATRMRMNESVRTAQLQLKALQQQGQALEQQRQMEQDRRAADAQSRARDEELRMQAQGLHDDAVSRFNPSSMEGELSAEQARLADIIAPPSDAGDINQSAADITHSTTSGLSGTLFDDTLATQAGRATDQFGKEAGALADMTAYGIVGDRQSRDMNLHGANMGVVGGLRRGVQSANDEWNRLQDSRVNAMGAAGDVWANLPIYQDNTMANDRGTLGMLLSTYALGNMGKTFGDPNYGKASIDLSNERPYSRSYYPDMVGP